MATPIGNLADITLRALRVLGEVDVIAAEDTRSARTLLAHHGVRTPLVSYHRDNEEIRAAELAARLEAGESVALISEAGTPSISDPGYRLVRAAIERGVAIEPIPGASALLAALVVAGLPTERFVFEGFLPRRSAQRRSRLEELSRDERTLVFFEAPHRLDGSLADMLQVLGNRDAALCRELTKLHEHVRRGTLSELIGGDPVKGEIVLVVSGTSKSEPDMDAALTRVRELHASGGSLRDAVGQAASETGVSRHRLYEAALRDRQAHSDA